MRLLIKKSKLQQQEESKMKAALDAVIKYIRFTAFYSCKDNIFQYFSSSKVRVLDFVDRCCCRYTPVILSILMLITGTIDTLGQPINCMVPQEFSGSINESAISFNEYIFRDLDFLCSSILLCDRHLR